MAVSNRDRVGRAFEQLAAGLAPYVDRRMRMASRAGRNWMPEYASAVQYRGDASLEDPAFLLRVMVDCWDRAFTSELSRTDRNFVFELRDVRNRWAHNQQFTVRDTYRALDSIEQLLTSIDAHQAAQVGQVKDEVARQLTPHAAEPAATAAARSGQAGSLRPWREVVQPHDDVARGRFSLAEFAADLYQVSLGEGRDEYSDPVQFFRRTFLTAGLRQLLSGAVERLAGDGASSPVVDLQTTFGGGKTHSMIALYHLFSETPLERFPSEVQDLVREQGISELPTVRRAVLAGHRIPPGQPSVMDGTEVRTLWGNLAWQLGGAAGYAEVAASDRAGTSPGDALRGVLRRAAPCLILVDEWVAYARQLYADDTLCGGTFDTHFSFAQLLTEIVRQTDRALLVVSIPASSDMERPGSGSLIEVGGTGGREALRRLRSVIGRLESSWRPATAEESFEIVRRRLFQPIDGELLADRDATARALGELYRRQAAEFPVECREPAYEERVRRAYPFHPELFARLYEDWSALERFQRTRGVLRLLASVVYALWSGQDRSPVILPGGVPLADVKVAQELTRNLEDNWKPILEAEVDGAGSLPRAIDDQYKNLGRYGAATRAARTVFLGSAPRAGSPNQGIEAPRVRLGCALPGENVAAYGDALSRLADRAAYFYAQGGRYWYGTQPGLSRLARDRAERLLSGDRHELHADVAGRLRNLGVVRGGPFTAVHAAPSGPADVRDEPTARLVVLAPDTPHRGRSESSPALQVAQQILDQRAGGQREHRNMLVFLAADERQVEDLYQAVADDRAWNSLINDTAELDLPASQIQQALARVDDAEKVATVRLEDAYQWLLVPQQERPTEQITWADLKLEGGGSLVERASERLVRAGRVYTTYPPVLLRLTLNPDGGLASLWEDGFVEAARIWDAYSRYLYLHRLRDAGVLLDCVSRGPSSTLWADEGFAVAEAVDPRQSGRFTGLARPGTIAPSVRETTLVVRPDLAMAQVAEITERVPEGDGERSTGPAGQSPQSGGVAETASVTRRFYGHMRLDPNRMSTQARDLAGEVVANLNALDGTMVEVNIDIRATNQAGFPEDIQKLVRENTDALGMRDSGFEPE